MSWPSAVRGVRGNSAVVLAQSDCFLLHSVESIPAIRFPPPFHFPLVERYMHVRLGVDLRSVGAGKVEVVESPRRLKREQSYGFLHALWWLWLADGRSVASVPPGAGEAVKALLKDAEGPAQLFDPDLEEGLRKPVDEALEGAGYERTDSARRGLMLACGASQLRRHQFGDCRQLTDASVPPAEGLSLPEHCFPDGIVYGVVVEGKVVSVAHAHRAGLTEDAVADLGVETAPAYRWRGYDKTVVSAVVEHMTRSGGEALYGCGTKNAASIATAGSVGFVPFGRSLILSAPSSDVSPYSVCRWGFPLSFPLPNDRWLLRHPWLRSPGVRREANRMGPLPGRSVTKRFRPVS